MLYNFCRQLASANQKQGYLESLQRFLYHKCKLCRDEGCFELAKYLCRLDFVLADLMDLELARTTTIAEGGGRCDFRYRRKR